MDKYWRYTIAPDWELFEDKEMVLSDLDWECWCEYPHLYNNNWVILKYWAVIIQTYKYDIEGIEDIEENYWIYPTSILKIEQEYHLVFRYTSFTSIRTHKKIQESLAYLYSGIALDYHFLKEENIYIRKTDKTLDNLVTVSNKIFGIKKLDEQVSALIKTTEFNQLQEANSLDIQKVIEVLYEGKNTLDKMLEWVSLYENKHMLFGSCFTLVYKHFNNNINNARKFFIEKYDINFIEEEYENNSVEAVDNLIERGDWYYVVTEKAEKKISDFIISVHYKILNQDGTCNYIVSLNNNEQWQFTPKIFWCNKTWTAAFADYIQKYWNFHFYWSAWHIKLLHSAVSSTRYIPYIKQIIWFWHHEKYNIIIFKNWIWNTKEWIFTPKEDLSDSFYLDFDQNWYMVTSVHWEPLLEDMKESLPTLQITEVFSYEKLSSFFSKMYSNEYGLYLMFLLFWMYWHLLYWKKKNSFPLIFTRWITWSGKTAFNKTLRDCWGIDKWVFDFENSTSFVISVYLSQLIKFPLFIAEYREAANNRLAKVWTLRSAFDKVWQSKGKQDLTTIKFDYYWVPVLDWEEMITDGALRTRSLQLQLSRKYKVDWNFEEIISQWWEIIKWIMYSYLEISKWYIYEKSLSEWFVFFKTYIPEDRIADNLSKIYAWCMCFDSSKEKEYKKVLKKIWDFQIKDFRENSTTMQIIKIISKFLERDNYNSFFFTTLGKNSSDFDTLVISRQPIEDYVTRFKVETTLKISSYIEHIESLWFNVDYITLKTRIVRGIIVPFESIPKDFLSNSLIYEVYNKRKSKQNDLLRRKR